MASLPVTDALHKKLKVECAKIDENMKDVTDRLVELYLDNEVEVFE